MKPLLAVCTLVLLGTPALASAASADDEAAGAVTATLLTESSTLPPGGSVRLALHLQHAPHWHTYWRNPGDSGLATRLKWNLPAGYTTEDIVWPTPTRFDVGGLYNFGYTGDTLLTMQLHVPADVKVGDTVAISAEASWLMCREQCFPGKASLRLALPVKAQAAAPNDADAALFAHVTADVPRHADWQAQARTSGETVVVTLRGSGLPAREGLDAFVEERKLVAYAPPQISATDNSLTLVFPKSDYFTEAPAQLNLLLVRNAGVPQAWRVTAPIRAP